MGLELGGVQRVVEKMLDDELQLWRDTEGRSDDVLDEATGRLVSPAADCEPVWEGHGAVVPVGQGVMVEPLDGALAPPSVDTAYKVLLPLAAPPTRSGDLLILVRSLRDPQLVGRRFLVGDAPVGMFAVVRTVRLQAEAEVGGEEGR